MIKITLLRHGITLGNLHKRYVGTTDEPLYEEGIKIIEKMSPPFAEAVFSSPLKRCVQTASLLFPDKEIIIRENLKECAFGDFENKNYKELSDNPDYQKWIDSNGEMPFPGGESVEDFKERTIEEFKNLVEEIFTKGYKDVAIVAHGGTIMSIMERYSGECKEYYQWRTDNLEGFSFFVDEKMHLTGIEPTPLAPEAKALSIELQMH